jgi:hypothetical protein
MNRLLRFALSEEDDLRRVEAAVEEVRLMDCTKSAKSEAKLLAKDTMSESNPAKCRTIRTKELLRPSYSKVMLLPWGRVLLPVDSISDWDRDVVRLSTLRLLTSLKALSSLSSIL